MAKQLVIYIPGLGDPNNGEKALLKIWSFYQLEVIYHPLYWNDNRPFIVKLNEVIDLIERVAINDTVVSLVGISAGASAVLNVFAEKKESINKVVCICGKINNPNTISPKRFEINPSFKESLDLLPSSLNRLDMEDRKRIFSLHPIYDGLVPIKDTFIEGANNKLMFSAGHAASIVYADTIHSYLIAKYIKSKV